MGVQNKVDILDSCPHFFCDVVRDRLQRLLTFETLPSEPLQLVVQGFCSPVKIFIKNEPHKREKLDKDRYRLISVVDLADEVIERMLCSLQNMTEIAEWKACPSVPGIGFTDEMMQEFYDSLRPWMDTMASDDAKAWDWRFREWMLEIDYQRRCNCINDLDHTAFFKWKTVLRNRFHCLLRSVFVLSDGSIWQHLVPGIMKSGSFVTSSTNSGARNGASYLVQLRLDPFSEPRSRAMGDDCVERYLHGLVEAYSELGIQITDYEKSVGGQFEFCSHLFDSRGIGSLKTWPKTLYRFLSLNSDELNDQTRLAQFRYELRHCPELERCLNAIHQHQRTMVQRVNNEEI